MWLWLVLWGAAFVLRERDEIRFDVIHSLFGPRVRRGMTLVAALALVGLYGYSLPAVWDYVTFMKTQKSSYLDIRFDRLFSIYPIFAIAVLIRYGAIIFATLTGRSLRDDLRPPEEDR